MDDLPDWQDEEYRKTPHKFESTTGARDSFLYIFLLVAASGALFLAGKLIGEPIFTHMPPPF